MGASQLVTWSTPYTIKLYDKLSIAFMLCVTSCFFPRLMCMFPSVYRNYWSLVVHEAAEITRRRDQMLCHSQRGGIVLHICLVVCSLAVITSFVSRTVSLCYLSVCKLIMAADFLMYSPITNWLCDEMCLWQDDRWRLDHVRSWLVAL